MFNAVTVAGHELVAISTEPNGVSLHPNLTFPCPHSLAIALRSFATRSQAERDPTLMKPTPSLRTHPTDKLYSVEVIVVVWELVTVDDPVVVTVEMSQSGLSTPDATSLTALFSSITASPQSLPRLILRYPPKLQTTDSP